MKKLYSLLKASMTSGMNLFKIKRKKNSKISGLLPLFIAAYLMFMIWGSANSILEKLAPLHIGFIILPLTVFIISIMTFMEGIYKSGDLIFNCKDDQLLLSLPIKKTTILFVRIFKFYVFELLFNSLFLLPIMIAYIRWDTSINWSYFLTSTIMLLMLPIIPIVLSGIIGTITSSISSRFKYKNIVQILISFIFLLGMLLISSNTNNIFEYLMAHATSINDLITKIYYPAGLYTKLVLKFNVIDLLIFVLSNIGILILFIYILSKFYFKINTRMKSVVITQKHNNHNITIKRHSKNISLIKKELNTFFTTPVFIINSGFALILFLIVTIVISSKLDNAISIIANQEGLNISKTLILDNLSLLILVIVSATSYMTSITNSVISLEGKNINILKSLPVKAKTILMTKIYSCLVITTPILFLGDIILFLKFKISFIEVILLLILSILIPLVSHFIGLLVNLKHPKLDAENSTEIVKQSASSFISVMIGMILFVLTVVIISSIIGKINSTLLLIIATILYVVVDILLYLYLINKGVKRFNSLSI